MYSAPRGNGVVQIPQYFGGLGHYLLKDVIPFIVISVGSPQ